LSIEDLVAGVGLKVTQIGWKSQFRANIRMVSRYRVGDVFLAGDAAHVHSPAGGQGLNTGIQDAYNLGWKLATGNDDLLDTYEQERLPVAAAVLGISTRLHRAAIDLRPAPRSPCHAARVRLAEPTARRPPGDRPRGPRRLRHHRPDPGSGAAGQLPRLRHPPPRGHRTVRTVNLTDLIGAAESLSSLGAAF
jgi:hypothetical protein